MLLVASVVMNVLIVANIFLNCLFLENHLTRHGSISLNCMGYVHAFQGTFHLFYI